MEIPYEKVLNIYLRGSRLAGNFGKRFDGSISDWDFVMVLDIDKKIDGLHISFGNIDCAVYDDKTFQKLLNLNLIWVLECIYVPDSCKFCEKK